MSRTYELRLTDVRSFLFQLPHLLVLLNIFWLYTVTLEWFGKAIFAKQHRCIAFELDVPRSKLIYVIFQFVLLRITIMNLTKH